MAMSLFVVGLPPAWATAAISTGRTNHQYEGASARPAKPTAAEANSKAMPFLPPMRSVTCPAVGDKAAPARMLMAMRPPI